MARATKKGGRRVVSGQGHIIELYEVTITTGRVMLMINWIPNGQVVHVRTSVSRSESESSSSTRLKAFVKSHDWNLTQIDLRNPP